MAALLGAGALVLDVVAGHADLDEAADQVAHVRVTAVAGVGVGDDERPVVILRRRGALPFAHLQPQVLLIAVGGQQGAHQHRGVVGHLAQRIAGEVGPGILGDGALGRGRPAAEVDALDAHPLHAHGLAGRVGAERRDALLRGEQLAQPVIERRRRLARHGVVGRNGAALLDDLAGRVQAGDPGKARTVEVSLRGRDVLLERCADLGVRFDDGHGFTLLFGTISLNVSLSRQMAVQSGVISPEPKLLSCRAPTFSGCLICRAGVVGVRRRCRHPALALQRFSSTKRHWDCGGVRPASRRRPRLNCPARH